MRYLVFAVAIFVASLSGYSQSKFVEYSGDILHLALPGAAFASTLIWSEENYSGTKEFIWAAGVSTVVTYALKYAINKERPNGEGHAFPSGHTYRAFMGAEFIRRKFGWEAGVPVYLLAGYTGYTRVYANKHDYWDILAGATVGIVSSYIFAKPYFKNQKIGLSFGREYDSFVLNLQMSF